MCIAICVFHFGIKDCEIDFIVKALSKNGLLVFNVNTRYASIKMSIYKKFCSYGFWGKAISGSIYGLENDTVFIMSRTSVE